MGDINVSLGVTGKEVVTGAFQDVAGSAKAMGDALMEHTKKLAEAYLGYESIVKVMETFSQALELGGKISELSDQTGLAADRLVVMQRAFQNSGLEADDLGKIINKMQKFLQEASDSSSVAAEKLGKLGLSGAYLKELGPEEQMRELAKAISEVGNPTERAADAMEIFGKSGGKTLKLLKEFDQTISESEQQVGGLADVMGKNSGIFNEVSDALKSIKDKTVEFAVGILDKAMPALETLTSALKNIDATKFGQQFSEELVKGIDFVLGIFQDPGDTFLAFGDALTVALKTGINSLMDGLKYVFDWSTNFISEIIPSYADLLKSVFNIAVGAVVGFFGNQLSKVLSDLAVLIPGQLGDAMGKAAEKLATFSKDATDLAQQGLADAWDKIGSAATNATEQTHLQSQDWTDVAGSAQQMRDHVEAVRANGEAFRDQMAQANEHAKSTAEWLSKVPEIGREFSNLMSGPEKTIQDMLSPNNGVGPQASGPNLQYQGTNPGDLVGNYKNRMASRAAGQDLAARSSASASILVPGSGSSAPVIPASFLGPNPYDNSVKSAQQSGNYWNYLTAKQSQQEYNQARRDELDWKAGQRQASQDYTGNSQTSFADLFAQVQEKYRNMGYNYKDAENQANKELQDYIQKNPGPRPNPDGIRPGPGYDDRAHKSPEATLMDKIYALLEKHVPKIDDKLPLMALS